MTSTEVRPDAPAVPRPRSAPADLTPAELAERMPIEIQGVSGFFLSGDRSRVVKGADKPRTFIDPAPRVTAWGLSDGEPWYFVHVGPYERIVTKSTLVDGSAWDTFPNVPAAGSRTGREALHCLVRQLVQLDDLAETTVATTTGWYDLPAGPVFVTGPAGVAIGAGGPVDVRTQLDMPREYGLPAPPTDRGQLAEAWRASVALLNVGPLPVIGGLLACAYLAPLSNRLPTRATFMLWIEAEKESGKSTLTALVMRHFGAFTAEAMPFAYTDSVPATEQGLHAVRDLLAPVDDYRRTSIPSRDAEMDRLADFITRAVGNGTARQLLKRDRSRAERRNPQAGAYSSTAEVPLPAEWESAEARVFPVRLSKLGTPGGLRVGLDEYDQAARAGLYGAAMGGYLQWLAADLNGYAERYGRQRTATRRDLQARYPALPPRTWDQLACLWLGWRAWLDYGVSLAALTAGEAETTLARILAALVDQAHHNADRRTDNDQAQRAFTLLCSALGTYAAHTPDRWTGGIPATTPAAFGYRRTAQADPAAPATGFRSDTPMYMGGGPAIGWVDTLAGELILRPDAAYNAIAAAAGKTGMPLPANVLWERWAKAGLTVTEIERTKTGREIERSTPHRRVPGGRPRVVVVKLTALQGTDADEAAPVDGDDQAAAPEILETPPAVDLAPALPLGDEDQDHAPAPAPAADLPAGWTRGAELAECERCHNGRTLVRDSAGRPAHPGHATEPAEPTPPATTAPAPIGPQRPAQAAARTTPPAVDRAAQLADITRALVKAHTGTDGVPTREFSAELAGAVLDAWHRATGGLEWREWAGSTGIAAYYATRAQHGQDARGIAAARREDAEIPQEWRDAVRLHPDYVNPAVVPVLGQYVTELDVNAQYLAASDIPLGTGVPSLIDRPASVAPLLDLPGYVQLAHAAETDSPAWAGRLEAGAVLPMPTAQYLVRKRGVHLDAAAAYVWAQGNHRPHLAAWKRRFRDAWTALQPVDGVDDEAAALALKLLKTVVVTTLGGMLRSADNPTDLMRRSWSDHIIAESWTRALVKTDQAEAAGHPPMGMRRDSAWFLSDAGLFIPPALEVARKLGKWKVSRHSAVTADMVTAHQGGSPDLLNKAIKAAHEARKAAGL